ncbi:MAG: hypothetical protein OJF49_004110 [Ktedonobacterales bacterium]|nr:MAG: hypothetical protein OJF49_004110 [Ktedonobacterales bacterium]
MELPAPHRTLSPYALANILATGATAIERHPTTTTFAIHPKNRQNRQLNTGNTHAHDHTIGHIGHSTSRRKRRKLPRTS